MTDKKTLAAGDGIDKLELRATRLAERLTVACADLAVGIPLPPELSIDLARYLEAYTAVARALGLTQTASLQDLREALDHRDQESSERQLVSVCNRLASLTSRSEGYSDALAVLRARMSDPAAKGLNLEPAVLLLESVDNDESELPALMAACEALELPAPIALGIHLGVIGLSEIGDLDEQEPAHATQAHLSDVEHDEVTVSEVPSHTDTAVAVAAIGTPDASSQAVNTPAKEPPTAPLKVDLQESSANSPIVELEASEPEVSTHTDAADDRTRRSQSAELDRVIEEAMTNGRPNIAYWAARAIELAGEAPPISSLSLEAALLAPFARSAGGVMSVALDRVFDRIIEEGEASGPSAAASCSGALLGAIVSPYGPAPQVLERQGRSLGPGLADLFGMVAERAPRGDLRIAAKRDAEAESGRRLEQLQSDALALHERLLGLTTNYTPAVRVWHDILDGRLAPIFAGTIENADLEAVRTLVRDLSQTKAVDKLIDQQNYSRRRASRENLTSKARDWLRANIRTVIEFGETILEVRTAAAAQAVGDGSGDAWVRGKLRSLTDEVTATISLRRRDADPIIAGTAVLLNNAWATFGSLLGLGMPVGPVAAIDSPSKVLCEDLVCVTDVRIDADFAPDLGDPEFANKLAQGLADPMSPEAAIRARAQAGEFHVTELMLNIYPQLVSMRDEISSVWSTARRAYERRVDSLSHNVTRAAREQIISEARVRELVATLDALDPDGPDLASHNFVLDEAQTAIEDGRVARREDLLREIEELGCDQAASDQIESLLDAGQIALATDSVARLRAGEPLVEPACGDSLLAQFLAFERSTTDLRALSSRLKKEVPAAGNTIDLLVAAGHSKKLQPKNFNEIARNVLQTVGFTGVKLESVQLHSRFVASIPVTAAPVQSSPIPEFGSRMRSLSVVVINQSPTHDLLGTIREHASSRSGGSPIFVLLQPLSSNARVEVATAARRENLTFLLIDPIVVGFCATQPQPRLGSLFAATLPFTWSNPYVTHGVVPREMFFGRTEEFDALIDPRRSAFIFGGRQLGKSALLGRAVSETHDPASNRVTILVDLEAKRVGHGGRTDVIWGHIGHELQTSLGVEVGGDQAAVTSWIRTWLDAHPDGELRILLDETDRFLEMEATSDEGRPALANIAAFRDLVNRSDGRLKIVLAGLHSVQRFLNLPNQPFAHLGEPIPIGPLSWVDARELVEKPMNVLGYELDEYVVDRMLMLCGRHPSLLQHLCRAMVDHVSGKPLPKLPIQITNADLDTIYEDRDLRREIRRRFDWTLDLDLRYRALAYQLALRSIEDPDVRINGLSVSELHADVREHWPETFEHMHADVLRTLCDEMVSLLVFALHDGRYRLWSTNVLQLLGNKEEIEERLNTTDLSESATTFEPQAYRRPFGPHDFSRSPLTFGDERILLTAGPPRIRFVVGSQLSGIDHVIEALTQASQTPDWQASLRLVRHKRVPPPRDLQPGDQRVVHVAPVTGDITSEWLIERVCELRDSLSDSDDAVILVVDATAIDTWGDLLEEVQVGRLDEGVSLISLKRWDRRALRVWLDENQMPTSSEDERSAVYADTGGWPNFVDQFAKAAEHTERDVQQALKVSRSHRDSRERVIELMGLGNAPEILRFLDKLRQFSDANASVIELAEADDQPIGSALKARDTLELLDALTGEHESLGLEAALADRLTT